MYALILTLCSFAGCNGYVISVDDEWKSQNPCETELVKESNLFARAWGNQKATEKYLTRFNVREEVGTLTDYDFTCEKLTDAMIP